ncbi:MAG: hypothetical protein SV253_05000 [Halobacteria archaeon]|nr:hypothetical protein [Halobacteria archaeon]
MFAVTLVWPLQLSVPGNVGQILVVLTFVVLAAAAAILGYGELKS